MFFADQSTLSCCHFKTDCNITIPISKGSPYAAIRQKSAYHAKYLRISWTYLALLYRFGGRIGGMIIPIFVWQLHQELCYGNQLNLGDVHRHR